MNAEVEIDIEELRKDYESGKLSERELAKKYGISRSKVRTRLGLPNQKGKGDKVSVKVREKHNEQVEKRQQRSRENKQRMEEIEVRVHQQIIKQEYIDVFEGIRQSVEDMLELNEQMRTKVPELGRVLKGIKEQLKSKIEITDPLRDALWQAVGLINSIFAAGKMRIESRKELGSWFDRYEKFQMQVKYLNYYENVITSIFHGLNELGEFDYDRVRSTAIRIFPATEKFFLENETIPTEEPNGGGEQQQPGQKQISEHSIHNQT